MRGIYHGSPELLGGGKDGILRKIVWRHECVLELGEEVLEPGRPLVGGSDRGAGRFDVVVCGALERERACVAGGNYVELAARSVRGE